MLKLHIFDNNTHDYYIEDVVKNIQQDEKLTNGLESTSDIWKVTLPYNYEHSLDIIQADDLQAVLYDEDENHNITPFFTGYVTTSFNYAVDSHGAQAVQITLEDRATHLLKTPYTKDESVVIKGKFSNKTTGDLGVVQQICNACGLTWTSNIFDISTQVEAIADPGETCESLLKSVCKEMGYAYTTDANGQIYLIPLSTDSSISTTKTIHDIEMYDSINLTRRARSYRGSRIKWTELADRNDALIYRVTEGQLTIHPDCYVTITNGGTLPSTDGGYTYYDAIDLKNGSKIFSISNVVPDIHCPPGDGSVDYITDPNCFVKYGAKSLKMLITATASGHIDRMQATADIRYVASENVTYGDGNLATENLHEEDCRWIHDDSTATKYANFIAQYDRYCSNTFTFKTKNNYNLGDIIKLDENVYVGFWNYIMITRKTRTLVDYDESNKTFSGVWSYEAVSTDQFNYTQQVTNETQSAPPSTTYTQTLPNLSDVSSLQLYTDKSFLVKDLRGTSTQTMTIKVSVTAGLTPVLSAASYSDGTVIDIYSDRTHSNIPRIQPTSNNDGWELICYENKDAESISITAKAGNLTNTISISLNDQTQYYKFLGNYSADPTVAQAGTILVGDFYLNTTDGKTYECTAISGSTYTWNEMALNADNANKFLTALESATQAGVSLETMSDPNTVSWFNTIIAAKAVIDSLFSRAITILTDGAIHSESYSDAGVKLNTNPGFWLGANGQLLCDSGQMENLAISGNSVFSGSFNCTAIKTAISSPTIRGSVTASVIGQTQARSLAADIRSLQYGSGLQPAHIRDVSSAVEYVEYQYSEGSGGSTYRVSFYDISGNQLDIRTILSCTSSYQSSNTSSEAKSIYYYDPPYTTSPKRYTYANNSFVIDFYQGGNTLEFNIPNSSAGLTTGMAYKDSSGYLRIV